MKLLSPPVVLIVVSALAAAFIDFVLVVNLDAAILYVIPVAIGARYSSARTVILAGGLVIILMVGSLYVDQVPMILWPISVVAVGLIVALAAQSAAWRREERRRAQEAETARERLTEFMGMVVHDLRGPLTVAIGYTQIGLRQLAASGNDVTSHPMARTETALWSMRHLIDDLLDSTRIGAGRFAISVAPIDLADLTRRVVEEQQLTNPEHRIVVDAPPHVAGEWDSERLRQVLSNLISNAVKYSPSESEVRVALRPTDKAIMISVADRGFGIDSSRIDELFQPFARLGREREATGTGLGLYITKGIIVAHGGRIWVESKVGLGSTFFVVLPHHQTDPRAAPALLRETH